MSEKLYEMFGIVEEEMFHFISNEMLKRIGFILFRYYLTRCSSSLIRVVFILRELDEFFKNLVYLLSRRRIAEKGSTIETEQKEDKNVSS